MEKKLTEILVILTFCLAIQGNVINSKCFKLYCKDLIEAQTLPKSCLDLKCQGVTTSGVATIYPTGNQHVPLKVYCDQTTEGGGWTVFQRRMDGKVDFYRNWQNYKLGFGDVNAEHWLGNDNLAALTALHDDNELRVDLEDITNTKVYAQYSSFNVQSEVDFYNLTVAGFSGNAGDSLVTQNGNKFSTRDSDHDTSSDHCATRYKGGWWYNSCHRSNLNGLYLNGTHTSYGDGVNWRTWKGYYNSLKTTEIKVRGQI